MFRNQHFPTFSYRSIFRATKQSKNSEQNLQSAHPDRQAKLEVNPEA